MPAAHAAAVGSSTPELLDFSTFLRERTLNVYENKGQVQKVVKTVGAALVAAQGRHGLPLRGG